MEIKILYAQDGTPCVPERQFALILKAMKDLVIMQKTALKTHNGDLIAKCREREQNLIALANGYEYTKEQAKKLTGNE